MLINLRLSRKLDKLIDYTGMDSPREEISEQLIELRFVMEKRLMKSVNLDVNFRDELENQ